MRLVVICVFAACCCCCCCFSPAGSSADRTLERRKLREVLRQLDAVRAGLQHSEQRMNTPPTDMEDRCCVSALECYRANLQVKFNLTDSHQRKLYRSLKYPLTERGVCNSRNVDTTCLDCASHPKENVNEFFNRLKSLIQKGMNRLSMN